MAKRRTELEERPSAVWARAGVVLTAVATVALALTLAVLAVRGGIHR